MIFVCSLLDYKTVFVRAREKQRCSYSLITRSLLSQVTWNQVQGFTRVGSQLCKTLFGSDNFVRSACSASPAIQFKINQLIRYQIRKNSPVIISQEVVVYKKTLYLLNWRKSLDKWRRERGEVPRRKEEAKSPLVRRERESEGDQRFLSGFPFLFFS